MTKTATPVTTARSHNRISARLKDSSSMRNRLYREGIAAGDVTLEKRHRPHHLVRMVDCKRTARPGRNDYSLRPPAFRKRMQRQRGARRRGQGLQRREQPVKYELSMEKTTTENITYPNTTYIRIFLEGLYSIAWHGAIDVWTRHDC